MTRRSEAPAWLPPTEGHPVDLQPAGVYWDAVRVPTSLGDTALSYLGAVTGAVIADRDTMYWLVLPGIADGWRLPGVSVLGQATYLTVPPVDAATAPGPHWKVPARPERVLTPSMLLHDALRLAVREAARQ